MPKNRIYIPTFISSVTYAPARVLPHVYFYNGMKACETYYVQGYATGNTGSVISRDIEQFPYFDNYEGQDPTSGSRSLLFFNEPAVYGTTPTGSLYTDYWENYINLLYNPRTRLINCEAIIPLADYFKMELNDIVEWRGNYYHLRAINNYNLSNGECSLQLLGPILGDILPQIIPAIACDFDYKVSAPCSQSYQVGDEAFGGVVAYVDDCGCNGFVVSTGSIGTYEWGCSAVVPDNQFATDLYNIGGGWMNTQTIAAGCTQRPIAASAALAYTSSGYTNWCLPNMAEMNQIWNNRYFFSSSALVDLCLNYTICENRYWTSTTVNFAFTTGSGYQSYPVEMASSRSIEIGPVYDDKPRTDAYPVLAIRYFGDCYQQLTTTTTTCAPTGSTTTTTLAPATTTTIAPTTTTTIAPTTTTTTTSPYNIFGNCGRGNSVGEACSDALMNARDFWSNCNSGTFGGGCAVYIDPFGTLLTGYTHIFMNGANWDINPSTGIVSGPSSTQC